MGTREENMQIYPTNILFLGHALNKVLKDIINRYHVLTGHRVRCALSFIGRLSLIRRSYHPGWDCHGLPIENKALQELKARPPFLSVMFTVEPVWNIERCSFFTPQYYTHLSQGDSRAGNEDTAERIRAVLHHGRLELRNDIPHTWYGLRTIAAIRLTTIFL
jgi:hypothetical protein